MARSIGFLASELQSPNPRGVTRVARAYAEQLAAGDEFDLVCLVHPVPQQADVTFLGCDLRDWLAANPMQQVLPRRPLWWRIARKLARVTLSDAKLAAIHRARRKCRTLIERLRGRNGNRGGEGLKPLALRELDVLAVFDPFSEVYHRPIENEPVCVAGWFHDAIPLRIREGTHWDPDRFSAAVSRLTCKATKIICGSASAQRDLHAFFPRSIGRTVTILDGHDHARFRNAACGEDRAGILAKYVPDLATPYFIAVGAIEPRKNTVNILRACRHLRENSQRDFQLVLVGENGASYEDGAALRELCRTVRVVRTGYVSDAELPMLASGATALLYPSLWEGFGIPPLEAVSAGTLAIASDLASLPEVLGPHAIYCDPYDPQSIAAAMQQCLQMPPGERQRRIEAGIAHASRLTWDVAAAKFAALVGEHFSAADTGGEASDSSHAGRGIDGSRGLVAPGLAVVRRDGSVVKAA